ncbi:VanW family protein [Christensenellaceae bacterium OttesenSCG-928-M15]|nr:VanW family protein [Christensenellaceae bacterium OttesenSCG-928-M15]
MSKNKQSSIAVRVFRTLTLALAALCVLLAGYIFIIDPISLEDISILPNAADSESMLRYAQGVAIEGVPVGGMTLEEARAALWEKENSLQAQIQFTLKARTASTTLSSSDFLVSFNTEEILKEALADANTDENDETAATKSYALSYTIDFTPAMDKLRAVESDVYQAPQNASVEMDMNVKGYFRYTDGTPGETLDMDALINALNARAEAREYGEIDLPILYTEPEITAETLQSSLTRRSAAETSFKKSPYNRDDRVYNVKRAASLVNGFVLKPGETFSTNDTLGDRTYELGWKPAPAYVSGTTEDQAGGGVCQVSSTLYAAVVKADLEIVYRRNHSSPVGYISRGLDATINTGTIDFQFKNNTSSDIYLFAYTIDKNDGEIPEGMDDKTIHVEIYGEPFSGDYDEIRLSSEQLESLKPSGEKEIVVDTTVAPDYYKEDVERRNGSVWQSYKHYYKNDEEVRKEELAKSTYRAYAGKVTVGTGYDSTASATAGAAG